MTTKTKKTKKKKWGELGQCVVVTKGKRCQRRATYIDGRRHICRHHWMTEPQTSKYTKFKPFSRKGIKKLTKV